MKFYKEFILGIINLSSQNRLRVENGLKFINSCVKKANGDNYKFNMENDIDLDCLKKLKLLFDEPCFEICLLLRQSFRHFTQTQVKLKIIQIYP